MQKPCKLNKLQNLFAQNFALYDTFIHTPMGMYLYTNRKTDGHYIHTGKYV